jgi:long-chain acyl-CoA synthetase
MRERLPALRGIVGLDLPAEDPRSFAALLARGEEPRVPSRHPSKDAVAGFFYTSGTTGLPKGVVLTHDNLVSDMMAMRAVFPLDPGEVSLSFLPWAHALGQVCELHYGMSQGLSIAINDDIAHLLDNMKEVRPTMLIAASRVQSHPPHRDAADRGEAEDHPEDVRDGLRCPRCTGAVKSRASCARWRSRSTIA